MRSLEIAKITVGLLAGLSAVEASAQPWSQVVSYASEAFGSKQVSYVGRNNHIYELYATPTQSWRYADLTELTGAPRADGNFVDAYAWDGQGSKQVVYTTASGRILELYATESGWRYEDLTRITGAPRATGKYLDGYAWEGGDSKQVVYTTADGHIHELYVRAGGTWQHADLTELTGAPVASYRYIKGYAWETYGSKQVVYQTRDGHIHELYVSEGQPWRHADLTQLTGAPVSADSYLDAYAWEGYGSKQVLYRTGDGHVHELYVTAGRPWRHADLTRLAGAPASEAQVIKGYAWERAGSKQVVYRTADGHVHELYAAETAPWSHVDLTDLTRAPAAQGRWLDAHAWERFGSKQVHYTTADGHVHELFVTTTAGWEHIDLSALTGAPAAK